ncbi:MAG TPA: DUF4266 domain-containing protein [Campylobacterales bacterium]|nr:DUF4266 domain-containing protein [Campylobacterales bacterium]HHS92978.1 DUF4266 domain-containing protein [Campylobacterales bacterium]
MFKPLMLLLTLFFFVGCSSTNSKWGQNHVAPQIIPKYNGNALKAKLHNHIYVSKEATQGGNLSFGSMGGCGCR